MKMKLFLACIATAITACSGVSASDGYKITIPLSEDEEDATLFLVDYDNGNKIDSVTVTNAQAVFKGSVEKPVMARLTIEGQRMGSFILENADITLERNKRVQSPLNDKMNDIEKELEQLVTKYRAAADAGNEADADKIKEQYNRLIAKNIKENINNPISYVLFLNEAYGYSLPELKEALKKYPELSNYVRVKKLLQAGENKARTQPGSKFVDFAVTNDTITQKLSDYVGKGKYVLVDFWASWCGPCIRETQVLKDLLNQYGDDGLEVLGVAVWDDPDDTRNAIKQYGLPWPQIINAQTIPTDLYGISAIPCIMLIGPDGTILSRDKQDEELRAAVAKALAKK